MGSSVTTHNRGTNKSSSISVYNSSDEAFDKTCDPCGRDGDVLEAVGQCTDCDEYYCKSCIRTHSRSKLTKEHNILNYSTTSTVMSTKSLSTVKAPLNINKGLDTDSNLSQRRFEYIRSIAINHKDDKNCIISGMSFVSDNEMVITESTLNSVKMINIDTGVIISHLKFDTKPFDSTAVPNKEVVITFPDEFLLRILSTTGKLSVKTTIKAVGLCTAVEYYNDKLYVSFFQPVKFQVFNLAGGILKTIKPEAKFIATCFAPRYIAVHPDETKIYVSAMKDNAVLCMDINGALLSLYKDAGLAYPLDITLTPYGAIFLCNSDNHAIYTMSEDLSEARVVLGQRDGVLLPGMMCFNQNRKMLYTSSRAVNDGFCNNIKQYMYT